MIDLTTDEVMILPPEIVTSALTVTKETEGILTPGIQEGKNVGAAILIETPQEGEKVLQPASGGEGHPLVLVLQRGHSLVVAEAPNVHWEPVPLPKVLFQGLPKRECT